jgi:hypothetical protein
VNPPSPARAAGHPAAELGRDVGPPPKQDDGPTFRVLKGKGV